jgi:hypothetical protein
MGVALGLFLCEPFDIPFFAFSFSRAPIGLGQKCPKSQAHLLRPVACRRATRRRRLSRMNSVFVCCVVSFGCVQPLVPLDRATGTGPGSRVLAGGYTDAPHGIHPISISSVHSGTRTSATRDEARRRRRKGDSPKSLRRPVTGIRRTHNQPDY